MTVAQPRLTRRTLIGFTVGDFAFNLYWQSISIFLLFFYTDVVGLSAAAAGLIYMVASIFDAILDPFMGALADRTRTRWGRYRPYILFGTPLVGFSFALLYYRPPLEGMALILWMLGTHMFFRVAYTIASIPYTAMSARLTSDSAERGTIAGGRIVFATLAGLTIVAFTQPLAQKTGGGDLAQGFFWAACIFAALATLILPIVFLATREPDEVEEEATPQRIGDYWRALAANRALWIVVTAICTGVVCSTALGKSVLYYFKYHLEDEAAGRVALALVAASGLILVPAWVYVTKWLGKRAAWLAACGWGLVGLAVFAAADVESVAVAIAFFLWMHVSSLGMALGFWSLLPDTVEYGEWRTGLRTESFVFGLGAFFLKVALGLGAGLFGWLLGLIGYRANVAQTAETLENMKLVMVGLPAIGLLTAGIAMYFYPLRGRMHDDIVQELAARRTDAAVNSGRE